MKEASMEAEYRLQVAESAKFDLASNLERATARIFELEARMTDRPIDVSTKSSISIVGEANLERKIVALTSSGGQPPLVGLDESIASTVATMTSQDCLAATSQLGGLPPPPAPHPSPSLSFA